MRHLIVNANSLGITPSRSHGVFQCFEQGVVTNATLIPTGADADRAARHAKHKGFPCGIELSLTAGSPCCKPDDVSTLLERFGDFLDERKFRAALDRGGINQVHIERELREQCEWFFAHFGTPTHLSSLHHIHLHPILVPIIITLMLHYGIRFVRLPMEMAPPSWEMPEEELELIKYITAQAVAAKPLFEAHGISSTNHCIGMAMVGHASAKNLRSLLRHLGEGTTELITHPGQCDPAAAAFDRDPQRETELRMLCEPRLHQNLKTQGIQCCSYADL